MPSPPAGRRLGARHALIVVFLAALLLVLFEGSSIRQAGEEMEPGLARELTLAIGSPPAGYPTGSHSTTGRTTPSPSSRTRVWDRRVGSSPPARHAWRAGCRRCRRRRSIPGSSAPARRRRASCDTLLVTGDSLSMPLDVELARQLADTGVEVERDPHVGTGISKTGLVDWGRLSTEQTAELEPDAVVVFIGANEGFELPGADGSQIECCGPDWAAEYAFRARRMMNTYRRGGRARVYWLTLPAPRENDRQRIARAVNAAIEVAAQPYRAHVRVLDMEALFTPGGRYRDAMTVGGRPQIVREPDGIHLNARGAELASDAVLDAVERDFAEALP